MTELVLVSLIACLCNTFSDKEDKAYCYEKYTNCVVYGDAKPRDSQIMTKKEFDMNCNILPHQERCNVAE